MQSKGALDRYSAATPRTPPTFALQTADDLVVFPRVETFFDLTDNADLSLGASGAIGKNKPKSEDRTFLSLSINPVADRRHLGRQKGSHRRRGRQQGVRA